MSVTAFIKSIFTKQGPADRRRGRLIEAPRNYFVNESVLQATHSHLQREGRNFHEGLVYWIGWYSEESCIVTSVLVPRSVSRYGGVTVSTEEMARINNALRQADLLLVAQIHTHPGDHGHSAGDDGNAVSSLPGFLSIVVPNFAQAEDLVLSESYVHRYQGAGRWCYLQPDEVSKLIHIDPFMIPKP